MRGTKAKRLRRENPDPHAWRQRQVAITHPINPDLPSRSARRASMRAFREFRVRAARARDRWAGSRGTGTPSEPISEALKRQAGSYQDGDDGRSLMPPRPSRRRWRRDRGALIPRKS